MSEDGATGLFQEKFAMGNTPSGVLMMSKKRHRKTPRNLNGLHNNFFFQHETAKKSPTSRYFSPLLRKLTITGTAEGEGLVGL